MTTIQLRKSSSRSPWRYGLLLIAFLLALIALPSFAVKPSPVGVTITQATGYLSNDTLIITGTNFAAPVVNLDNMNLTVTSSNATTINADLPAGIGPGSYHLRVTTSTGIANIDLALDNGDLGGGNTAKGDGALASLTTGGDNTAVGFDALQFNVSADTNAALGAFAAQNNDSSGAGTAFFNTAVGGFALQANVDGTENTAVGAGAMESGDGGNDNTAIGELAGNNITGNFNTCLGHSTGSNLAGGEGNIYIGAQVQPGNTGEQEFIRIGDDTAFTFPYDTFIAGIFNRDVDGGTAVAVFVDATGKLGTNAVDAAGNKVPTPQAMLNESRNQQKRITELEGTVARLAALVKQQAAQIQKVSAQIELSKPAPRTVANKP